jgi:hypothetical protein
MVNHRWKAGVARVRVTCTGGQIARGESELLSWLPGQGAGV